MEEKQKFNWKRSLITIVIVLVTAGVVGGVTWYLMDRNANDIKAANDKSMEALQKTITDLKSQITDLESKTTTTTNTTTTPSVAPRTVVNNFLTAYLVTNANNQPTARTFIAQNSLVTNSFKSYVNNSDFQADPIILAQNTPDPHNNPFTVDNATISGNNATVPVSLNFSGGPHHLIYSLTLVNNEWKINSVAMAN